MLYPGTVLKGKTVIGEDCVIGPASEIEDCVIMDGAAVKHSVLNQAQVGTRASVGPLRIYVPAPF